MPTEGFCNDLARLVESPRDEESMNPQWLNFGTTELHFRRL